jgi:hypothetical protein
MERASHRSGEGTGRVGGRFWSRTGAGAAAGLAVVALAAVAVAPAGAASARSSTTNVTRARSAACLVTERAAFKPATVIEGRKAHLVVVLHNCSDASLNVELTRYGNLVCLVADPVAQAVTLTAYQTKVTRSEYVAPSCLGTGHITATVTSSTGKRLATRTAHLDVVAPPPST